MLNSAICYFFSFSNKVYYDSHICLYIFLWLLSFLNAELKSRERLHMATKPLLTVMSLTGKCCQPLIINSTLNNTTFWQRQRYIQVCVCTYISHLAYYKSTLCYFKQHSFKTISCITLIKRKKEFMCIFKGHGLHECQRTAIWSCFLPCYFEGGSLVISLLCC